MNILDRPIVVATRFFEKDSEKAEESRDKLAAFCVTSLDAGAKHVLVAVNVDEDKSQAACGKMGVITYFPVQPWGKFVMPLNAILVKGREYWRNQSLLLSASVEVTLTEEVISTLVSHMDKDTLVVGAALPGHEYSPGIHNPATGQQTPWNTLALWSPHKLWNNGGVPLLGDGPLWSPELAGVEEVMTIASVQHQVMHKAKLVEVPGQNWDTSSFDEERLRAHEKKMASKNSRPKTQLAQSGLEGPCVIHT